MPLSIDTARCRERRVIVVERKMGGKYNGEALMEDKDEGKCETETAVRGGGEVTFLLVSALVYTVEKRRCEITRCRCNRIMYSYSGDVSI